MGDGQLLLGEDSESRDLRAVVLLYDVERDREIIVTKLAAVAVDFGLRRTGLGAQALGAALQASEDRAYGTGGTELLVAGYIHRDNAASQELVSKFGFSMVGYDEDGRYQEWHRRLMLSL